MRRGELETRRWVGERRGSTLGKWEKGEKREGGGREGEG